MGYEEVQADPDDASGGRFMKFKKVGDKCEAYYVGTAAGTYGDDYTFRRADGSEFVITANLKDLKSKLNNAKKLGLKPGHQVAIMFVEDKDTGNEFKLKLFKVLVNKAPKVPMPPSSEPEPETADADPFAGGDEDVPF